MTTVSAAQPGSMTWVRWIAYLTVLTPLVVVPGFYLPFVVPRAVFFRAVVVLAVPALVWTIIRKETKYSGKDPVVPTMLAFLIVAAVSAAFGASPIRSIYGDFERMWGLLAWGHLALFYIVLRTGLNEKDWGRFFDATAIVGGVVAAIALLQSLTATFPDWLSAHLLVDAAARPASTAGNTGYLAAYMLVAAAMSTVRAVDARPIAWRRTLVLLALLEIWVVFLTQSRGAVVGIAAAALFAAILFVVRGRGRVRIAALLSILAMAFAGGTLLLGGDAPLREVPLLTRFVGAADNPRVAVWEAAIDASLERPIFGIGLENAHVAITPAGGSDLYDEQRLEGIWDRVHNVFLEALVAAGIPGLVAYSAWWVAVFVVVVRARRRRGITEMQFTLILAFLVAYLTHLFFWFEDWVSLPPTLALVAFAVHRGAGGKPLVRFGSTRAQAPRNPRLVVAFAAATIAIVIIQWGVRPLRGAWYAARALTADSLVEQVPAYERSLDFAGIQGLQVFFEMTNSMRTAEPATAADTLALATGLVVALEAAAEEIEIDPQNDMLHAHRSDLLRKALQLEPRSATYEEATRSASRAIALGPHRMENYYRLADLHLYVRESDRALAVLDSARSVRDDMASTDQMAASAHVQAGRLEAGFAFAQRSLALGGSDHRFLEALARRLANAGRPDLGVRLLEEYLIVNFGNLSEVGAPKEVTPPRPLPLPVRQLAAQLPIEYLRLGNREGAARTARFLLTHEPGAESVIRRFLDDLAAGRDSAWIPAVIIPLPPH